MNYFHDIFFFIIVPDSPKDEDIKTNNSFSSCYKNSKAKQRFSFEMKVDESTYYDVPILSPTLSPVVDEIASPTYPNISSLNGYKPAKEIDGHMSFPAMPYCVSLFRINVTFDFMYIVSHLCKDHECTDFPLYSLDFLSLFYVLQKP